MGKEHFVEEFRALHRSLTERAEVLRAEIEVLLAARCIKVHLVSCRVKSVESLRHKLARPDRNYGSLWDITDRKSVV